MAIDPTGQDLKTFASGDLDEPVVMLNLLRYADGGRERYAEYLRAAAPAAQAHGAELLYYGETRAPLVAEEGEDWDAVLLMRYPSRRSFLEMVSDPAYQEHTHLRSEALAAAVLQPTVPPR